MSGTHQYSKLVDFLEVDGGWWTVEALTNRFPTDKPETIRRALIRRTKAGQLESRRRLVATHEDGKARAEWRATAA